jgi:ketosteroid isomerase-like protein
MLGLISAAPLAYAQSEAQRPADEKIIRQLRLDYNAAIAARDPKAMAKFCAPEMAEMASTGEVNLPASKVIADYINVEFKDPTFIGYERLTDTVEISPNGRFAVERGHWRGRFKSASGAETGSQGLYQAGWIKRDGTWQVRSEAYVKLVCRDEGNCL